MRTKRTTLAAIAALVAAQMLVVITDAHSQSTQVDLETARRAALYFGAQRWGRVVIYDQQLLVDPVSNKVEVYSFVLAVSDQVPPGNNEVKNNIIEGTRLRERALARLYGNDSDAPIDTTQAFAEITIANNLLRQGSVFGTIEIGANMGMPPFVGSKRGLPDWLSHSEASRVAAERMGIDVSLATRRQLWFGPLLNGVKFISNDDSLILDHNQASLGRSVNYAQKEDSIIVTSQEQIAAIQWRELIGLSDFQMIGQATSLESAAKYPSAEGYIENVPYYEQDRYGVNTCGPTAVGQALGYFDGQYQNLVDYGGSSQDDNSIGVRMMIENLKVTLGWDAQDGVTNFSVEGGVEQFCNDSDYGNNLSFNIDGDLFFPSWNEVKARIDEQSPLVILFNGEYIEPDGTSHNANHFMTIVGYNEIASPAMKVIILHPNDGVSWNEDLEINWDVPSGTNKDTWEFFPSGSDNLIPTCQVQSPNFGGTFNGVMSIDVTFADASGIWDGEIQYSLDHTTWHTFHNLHGPVGPLCALFNTYSIEFDPSVWVRIRVRDNWGNYSTWDECDQSFIVDNRGPQPTSIALNLSLSPSSTTPYATVQASGTALYNTGSPVTTGTVLISHPEGSWTASLDANGNFSRPISAPGSSNWVSATLTVGSLSGSDQEYLTVTPDGNGSGYTFYRSAMCRDADDNYPYDPIGETHWFRTTDPYVYSWVHLTYLYVPVQVRWYWYLPNGSQFQTPLTSDCTDDPNAAGYDYWEGWKLYYGWSLAGYSLSDYEGRHSVKIYAKECGEGYDYMESQYWVLAYDLAEHKLCKDVGPYPNDPITPTSTFLSTDSKAVTWTRFEDVSEAIAIRWEYYEPSGALYGSYEHTTSDPGQGYYYEWMKAWGWIWISGYPAASKCGRWTVKVYEKDAWNNWDELYTDYFVIQEASPQVPTVSVSLSPDLPIEGQNVVATVTGSDNCSVQSASLFWSVGTPQSNNWSNIFQPSFSGQLNLGVFAEGQSLEVYARVTDASGHVNESQHVTSVIRDSDTQGPQITEVLAQEHNGNGDNVIGDNEQVRISASVVDPSGVAWVSISIDGNTIPLTGNYFVVAGPFPAGSHQLVVSASDADQTPAFSTVYSSFNCSPPPTPRISLSTDSITATLPAIGTECTIDQFWVRSIGSSSLQVSEITLDSMPPGSIFIPAVYPPVTIAVGESLRVEVRLCPDRYCESEMITYTTPGTRKGNLKVLSNDPTTPSAGVGVRQFVPEPGEPSIVCSVSGPIEFNPAGANVVSVSVNWEPSVICGSPPNSISGAVSYDAGRSWESYVEYTPSGFQFYALRPSDSCLLRMQVTDVYGRTAADTTDVFVIYLATMATVVSSYPEAFASCAPSEVTPVLVFDRPVDLTTITESTVKVVGQTSGAHQYSAGPGLTPDTVMLTIFGEFFAGERTWLSASEGITSVSGEALSNAYSTEFFVEAGGSGVFLPRRQFQTGAGTFSISAVDFNSDGYPDIIAANWNASNISISTNDGMGRFDLVSIVPLPRQPWEIVTGDVNGDGAIDVVVGHRDDGKFSVLLNDNINGLLEPIEYMVGSGPSALSLGDIDGDGDLDVCAVNEYADSMAICLNTGTGTFGAPSSYLAADSPRAISTTDLDGDGACDIIVSNNQSDNLIVYLNRDDGFSISSYSVGDGPTGICSADFDGDNRADLAVGNWVSDNVSVLFNDGNGQFSEATSLQAGDAVKTVCCSDFDGDCLIDIAAANRFSNTVTVFKNNGNRTFIRSQDLSVFDDPWGIAAVDVDRDGDVDIVTGNNYSGDLSILLNSDEKNANLDVEPIEVFLVREIGGIDGSAVELQVGSDGAQLSFEIEFRQNWLTIESSSNSTPASISVGANLDTLGVGVYVDTLWISAYQAINSPVIVICSLKVTAPPAMNSNRVSLGPTEYLDCLHFRVPIWFANDRDTLAGISVPLDWTENLLNLDSVSWVDSRVNAWEVKQAVINSSNRTVLIGATRFLAAPAYPDSGLLCYLYFQSAGMALGADVCFDTTYIPPGGEFIFTDVNAQTLSPTFEEQCFEFQPSCLAIMAPNGGEVLSSYSVTEVVWTRPAPDVDSSQVWLSIDGGMLFNEFLGHVIGPDTIYQWTVPTIWEENCRIRVAAFRGEVIFADTSDQTFAIHSIGDVDGNSRIDLTDIVCLVNYMFPTPGVPECPFISRARDINCDGKFNMTDIVYLVNFIFMPGWPAPCPSSGPYAKGLQPAIAIYESATGSAGAIVVEIETEMGLSAYEFTLQTDSRRVIDCRLPDELHGLSLFWRSLDDGRVRVGAIDLSGKNHIPAGRTPILRIDFDDQTGTRQIELSGIVVDRDAMEYDVTTVGQSPVPSGYSLWQNQPNPFNPQTTISYSIPERCRVVIDIYNVLGSHVRKLIDIDQVPGSYSLTWDGRSEFGGDMPSGVYFYRIRAGGFEQTRKMVLLK